MQKIKILGRSISIEGFLLSAIVIGGVFLRMEAHKHLTAISPDGVAYVYYSSQVLQGIGGFERRGPFFQGLLLISYMIFGVSFQSSVLIPQFFGGLIPILMFFVGKRFFNSRTGLVAASLATLNPMLINMSAWVLRETVSVTLILAFILVVHFTIKPQSPRKSLMGGVFTGILAGLVILTREEMIFIIPPAYVAYLFIMEKKRRVFVARTTVFLLTTLTVMSPWLMYSHTHFGNAFHSYTIYMDVKFVEQISADQTTGASTTPVFIKVPIALFFGLWRIAIESPAVFSLLGLAFIPIGIMLTLGKRDIWILYLITGLDLALVSFFASVPKFFNRPVMLYSGAGPTRFFFSTAIPFNIIIAFGMRRFFPFLKDLKSKIRPSSPKPRRRRISRKGKLRRPKFSKILSISALAILGILILGVASYLPAYVFTFEDFDETSAHPFHEAAKYLNSTDPSAGVFTSHPDLLARYYEGPIYKLSDKGGFELILEEALKKGVKYILIDSTSITSLELTRLYYKSAYPSSSWTKVPSEFALVHAGRSKFGERYGLFFIQTDIWFQAAILGNTQWASHAPWEQMIPLLGGSTKSFDDTTALSSLDLSEYEMVVFADFLRPLNDTEGAYLETAIQNGLTVIVSGLSPFHLAGSTPNLTRISSWFGATVFSEAPKHARWNVTFTEAATEITNDLILNREYSFYTDSDWSTPIGAVTQPGSIVYANRVDDGAPTMFAHKFGGGASIFIGPRFGFSSPDEKAFRTFLQSLIISYLTGG